ncbi:acyl-CoA carboxylase subunit beta, partial [Thermodesulfobacteriota bacterium]
MRHQEKIDQLKKNREKAQQGGGPERIRRQHEKGKLTAQERLDCLLDPGSFVPLHEFARGQSTDFAVEKKSAWGDGVVSGYGTIEGRLVFVFSQDFTVMGGSAGQTHIRKICFLLEKARQLSAPVIGLNDSVGARIQEGIDPFGYGFLFHENSITSGVVPQISVIMGNCSGGAVYSPALTDFIFMVENTAQMFITGPKVIKQIMGEEVTMQELGGSEVHSRVSGVVDFLAADEQTCLREVRRLMGFLPSHYGEAPPRQENGDTPDR